ncbi:MAG: hypothetical protein HF976_00465 [ANME-2 cluster archaeon]|nr:hypothetical protein [ANME-2 cluster archaeon]MBC2699890.1 hypothetical protein [ANME-2 cluster archaeon]MBC2707353.1 hypothetical protein [ANME-2 cluster archaeon]MBC2748685.1 hypothetical protein [ANME-2 cluster archaeon]MBC2763045.1 hypothetical protein [ANME-2 cluster archaeon]
MKNKFTQELESQTLRQHTQPQQSCGSITTKMNETTDTTGRSAILMFEATWDHRLENA